MRTAIWPLLAILVTASLLGACSNQVQSDAALFTAQDSAGLPRFKPGLWVGVDPKCRFNAGAPVRRWPKCATGFLFGRRGLETVIGDGKRQSIGQAAGDFDYVVAAGDPMVVQYISKKQDPSALYNYLAVGRMKTDADGEVTAFATWPVICGPPPPKSEQPADPGAAAPAGLTLAPWPGLEIRAANCVAHDQAAVRFAAKASGPLADPSLIRWVRSGRR